MINMDRQDPGGSGPQDRQMLQVFQQKIGNLELTLNALIAALAEEGVINEDQINEKAQEIMQEIQEQRDQESDESGPGDMIE